MKTYLSLKDFYSYCDVLAEQIRPHLSKYRGLFPIVMGGLPIAIALHERLNLPIHLELLENDLIVDDLVDSGKTLQNSRFKNFDKAVLIVKNSKFDDVHFYATQKEGWIVFPHEKKNDIDDFVFRILEYFGENPTRPSLEHVATNFLNYFSIFLGENKKQTQSSLKLESHLSFYFLDKKSFFPVWGTIDLSRLQNLDAVKLQEINLLFSSHLKKLFSEEEFVFFLKSILESLRFKIEGFLEIKSHSLLFKSDTNKIELVSKTVNI